MGCPGHTLTDKATRDLLAGGRWEAGLARTPQLLGTRGPCKVGRAGAVEVIPGDQASPTIETGVRLQESQDRSRLGPVEAPPHHSQPCSGSQVSTCYGRVTASQTNREEATITSVFQTRELRHMGKPPA